MQKQPNHNIRFTVRDSEAPERGDIYRGPKIAALTFAYALNKECENRKRYTVTEVDKEPPSV